MNLHLECDYWMFFRILSFNCLYNCFMFLYVLAANHPKISKSRIGWWQVLCVQPLANARPTSEIECSVPKEVVFSDLFSKLLNAKSLKRWESSGKFCSIYTAIDLNSKVFAGTLGYLQDFMAPVSTKTPCRDIWFRWFRFRCLLVQKPLTHLAKKPGQKPVLLKVSCLLTTNVRTCDNYLLCVSFKWSRDCQWHLVTCLISSLSRFLHFAVASQSIYDI